MRDLEQVQHLATSSRQAKLSTAAVQRAETVGHHTNPGAVHMIHTGNVKNDFLFILAKQVLYNRFNPLALAAQRNFPGHFQYRDIWGKPLGLDLQQHGVEFQHTTNGVYPGFQPGCKLEQDMDTALAVHRLQFAFTVTFHYIFPQLTMGLALLLVVLKTMALRTGDEHYSRCARFWIKIFAINFAMGVVTGIPMEFQFGTNWAPFAKAAGGILGQTLAMEGVFSFFLESTFLGLLVFGEKRLGPRLHWLAAFMVFAGSWLSGFFIIATDAWMQNPVGYTIGPNGEILLRSLGELIFNPWILWQYSHNMIGAVVTASFVMSACGAFYLILNKHDAYGRTFLRVGVTAGFIATITMLFPTGDGQGKMIAEHQPVTLAAMEGLFETAEGAPLALVGQPDTDRRKLDNPLVVPGALSFLTYRCWGARVQGLDRFPRDVWPDNIALLYFSYHIMVGLGTIFIAVMML